MARDDDDKVEASDDQDRKPVPFRRLIVLATLVLAPFSPITWYAGIPLSATVLIAGALLQWRGFRAVSLVVAGSLGLVVSSSLTYGWEAYVATEHSVSGEEEVEQQRAEDAFDEAFDNAATIPSGTKDGGPRIDAGRPDPRGRSAP